MTIHNLHTMVCKDIAMMHALIQDITQSPNTTINEILSSIINNHGKQIRPLLVLLSSHACENTNDNRIKIAAMIELFHIATLLHDDVIDNSTLRRGQLTVNQRWGDKAGILVGDYLFAKAFELTLHISNFRITELLLTIAPQMGLGEIQQFTNRKNLNSTLDEYFDIIHRKTALLFAASTSSGAIINQANKTLEKALYNYGLHLGNTFQIMDDLIDYCSDEQTIGKNIGDDLVNGKLTLPLLLAFQKSNTAQQNLIRQSIESGNKDALPDILNIMHETQSIQISKQYAAKELDSAITALQPVPESTYKKALIDLAISIFERNY